MKIWFWIITGYLSSAVSALLFLFADYLFSNSLPNSEIVYYRILFFVNSLLAVGSVLSLQKINYWTLKLVLTTLILFSSRIFYVTVIDNTPIENTNIAEKYAIDLLASRAEKKQKDRLVNLENKVNELENEREVKDSLNSVALDSILRERQLLTESLAQYQEEFTDSVNNTKKAYIDSVKKKKEPRNIPDWFINVPQNYAAHSGSTIERAFMLVLFEYYSLQKGFTHSSSLIIGNIEVKGIVKRISEEIGYGDELKYIDEFTQVIQIDFLDEENNMSAIMKFIMEETGYGADSKFTDHILHTYENCNLNDLIENVKTHGYDIKYEIRGDLYFFLLGETKN